VRPNLRTYLRVKLSTMPITDITDKIITDAVKEAEHIISGAEQKVREIEKQLELSKKDIIDMQKKEVERNLLENERRITSVAYQEVKLQTDKAKRMAVNETFDDALLELLSLSDENYGVILKNLLTSLHKDVSGKITAPKERTKITKKILEKLQIKTPITPTDEFKGGIVITGDNFEYNLTFENLLANKKSSLEVDVAKILFT